MTEPAVRLAWQGATIVQVRPETPTATTLRLAPERPSRLVAGQHYVVRLTAPDGYTASRSYSVASAPEDTDGIELTVERLADGEVSGYLHDVAEVGDRLEVRGPIGRWFTWRGDNPAVLLGGGSGVVPLMAMLRHSRRTPTAAVHLVVSVRRPAELYYAAELSGPEVTVVYTRCAPAGDPRPAGRLRAADVTLPPDATAYVCGSDGFCEHATAVLLELGQPAERIRVERFGATS